MQLEQELPNQELSSVAHIATEDGCCVFVVATSLPGVQRLLHVVAFVERGLRRAEEEQKARIAAKASGETIGG